MTDQFELTRVSGQPVSDQELLDDLNRVSALIQSSAVTQHKYRQYGHYDDTTVSNRFGSWNKALLKAGLTISNEVNISDERLFENILNMWQYFGRQPRRSELAKPPSTISQSPYNRRFGSWTNALTNFVEYANSNNTEVPALLEKPESVTKTGRDPSLRLRWHVLQRDSFKCCKCGSSPAFMNAVELHVDHIKPWSKGGETVIENLQTLCSSCNLGKSDMFLDG